MSVDYFDKKCKIEQNEVLGRYVVASVDIKAGETIMLDHPILILPNADYEHRCMNCYKITTTFCCKCKIFPLCVDCKEHNAYDCQKFQQITNIDYESLRGSTQICGAIKCLLLHDNPETRKFYYDFLLLESHMVERRNTDLWLEYDEKIVQPLIKSGLLKHFDQIDINAELLQRFYGVIDVNSFEIRAPDALAMRSIYLRASLLAHNCVANVAIAIDEQYQMKIYANRDIQQNETLFYCYTNVLLGTAERRHLLKLGKYFHCECVRCIDPTELGSHMSSLICAPCATENRENGYIVQLDNQKWRCLKCDHTLKSDYVTNLLDRVKEEIFHAKEDIYRYELLLAKLNQILHRNHYLLLDIKQNAAAILRAIIMNAAHRPGRKVYERKVRLCQEILQVLRIVLPGISRLKAIALYELSNSWGELARLRFGEHDVTELELLNLLQNAETMLRESIGMLVYEPLDTPEGRLTKSMLKDLKDLQTDMSLLREKAVMKSK